MTETGHTGTGADEVAAYVAAVRDALSDLPPRERDELLEDLTAHLTEVAAEGDLPLWSRVGPPWEYAAELRASVSSGSGAAERSRPSLLAGWGERARQWLGRVDARTGPLLGHERASDFLRLLVPAWWVLRGYLAAMLFAALVDAGHRPGLLPRLADSTVVGLLLLSAFVLGSVWLARREQRLPRWPRRGVYAGSALLVLFGVSQVAAIDAHERWWYGPTYVYTEHDPYSDVTDVVPVDAEGRLLTGVRLLDQHGNPIDIGWWTECDDEADEYEVDEYGDRIIEYPRCPQALPWWDLLPPSAGPTPTPVPEVTAAPTPSPAPAGPQPSDAPTAVATPSIGVPTPDPDPATASPVG